MRLAFGRPTPSVVDAAEPPGSSGSFGSFRSFRGRSRAGTLGTGRPLLMRRAGRLPRNRQSGDGGREPAIAGMALSPCALFSQAPRRTNGHQLDGTSHCTRPHRGTVTVSPPDNPTSGGLNRTGTDAVGRISRPGALNHLRKKASFRVVQVEIPQPAKRPPTDH